MSMEKKIAKKVVVWLALVSMVVLEAEALTCTDVTKHLAPCLGYIRGAPTPESGCCPGVKTLVSLAKTAPDRRTACSCLKTLANTIKPFNLPNAQSIPKVCGANVPYPIDPSIDCSTVN